MAVEVDDDYKPSDDEPFMNERQREYFRVKLLAWKDEILKESKETIAHLQDENHVRPTLPIARRPKPTAPSNFAPVTASAS